MIVYHPTSLAGVLPFLHGKLEIVPWGFAAPGSSQAQLEAMFDWRELDAFAARVLSDGPATARSAAEAFVSAARHRRLREATHVSSMSLRESAEPTHSGEVLLGLDTHSLDLIPGATLIPRGDLPPETILEAALARRKWDPDGPAAVLKREATLLFVASWLAARPAPMAERLLVLLSSRLHEDPRLRVAHAPDGALKPTLDLPLPGSALVELVLHSGLAAPQVFALSVLLRQLRLSHVVLRRARHRHPVALDGERAKAT